MSEEQKIEALINNAEVPKTPETIKGPEKKVEQIKPLDTPKPKETPSPQVPKIAPVKPMSAAPVDQDTIVLHKVESILSQGMEKVYLSMDAGTQAAFKSKGEETSQKIFELLAQTKTQLKQVIELIVIWLRIVPKVNKYYIEQEAKIKADAIMEIYSKK